MVVFIVKRYAVRKAEKWRSQYARPKLGGMQYARGEGGVTFSKGLQNTQWKHEFISL